MNKTNKCIYTLRKLHTLLCTTNILDSIFENYDFDVQYQGQEASNIIKHHIAGNKPFVVGRLGTELYTLLNYKEITLPRLEYCRRYIKKQLYFKDWNNDNIDNLCFYTGFFPHDENKVELFCELILKEINNVDIWGCFSSVERNFLKELNHTIKIRLADIDPFLHLYPWTESLEGKKVLVIHPFEKTIISQFSKREFIFENKRMLPQFELKTIKAVQTLANTKCEYASWFEALESMKMKIDNTVFDIAIVGCGAYSLPLATYIKALGKSAVYLGGSTQILFGIKGKRWESIPEISALMNEHWVRPLPEETPENYNIVENGCYW